VSDPPQALCDESVRVDAQESVVCRCPVEARHLRVGEERVRPPDTTEHLIADAQLVLTGAAEVESIVLDLE